MSPPASTNSGQEVACPPRRSRVSRLHVYAAPTPVSPLRWTGLQAKNAHVRFSMPWSEAKPQVRRAAAQGLLRSGTVAGFLPIHHGHSPDVGRGSDWVGDRYMRAVSGDDQKH